MNRNINWLRTIDPIWSIPLLSQYVQPNQLNSLQIYGLNVLNQYKPYDLSVRITAIIMRMFIRMLRKFI